ncbi:MAG: hypothetical protein M3081_08765 [Gemmatimonadota bacterium]|nr:hypothetical protein [Gemmatimonadota bacterium]
MSVRGKGATAPAPPPDIPDRLTRALLALARYEAAVGTDVPLSSSAADASSQRHAAPRRGDARAAALERAAARAELRDSIVGVVAARREERAKPEQLLVELKALVQRAITPELRTQHVRAVTDDVLQWMLDAYFADEAAERSDRATPSDAASQAHALRHPR